jgi:hypothetical protein
MPPSDRVWRLAKAMEADPTIALADEFRLAGEREAVTVDEELEAIELAREEPIMSGTRSSGQPEDVRDGTLAEERAWREFARERVTKADGRPDTTGGILPGHIDRNGGPNGSVIVEGIDSILNRAEPERVEKALGSGLFRSIVFGQRTNRPFRQRER